jgi:hypothetical protein
MTLLFGVGIRADPHECGSRNCLVSITRVPKHIFCEKFPMQISVLKTWGEIMRVETSSHNSPPYACGVFIMDKENDKKGIYSLL